jgi:uncharacterized protein YuzE
MKRMRIILFPLPFTPLRANKSVFVCEPGDLQQMNKTQMRYFEQEDIIHLVIAEGLESRSLELSPNITVELNDQNELLGVEILNASKFLRDTVLESVQAKTLQLLEVAV